MIIAASLLGLLSFSGVAKADGVISAGMVQKHGQGPTPDYRGARVSLDGDVFGLAFERFKGPEAQRLRAEILIHAPIRIGRKFYIAPQVGLMPFDMMTETTGARTLSFGGHAGVRVFLDMFYGVSVVLEPIKAEGRFLRMYTPADSAMAPIMDKTKKITYSSTASLGYRW